MKELTLLHGEIAIVDDDDYERLIQWRWYLSPKGRPSVKMKGMRNSVYMYRFIMNAGKGQEVDHINGNLLDNRKSNLRWATRHQNLCNRKKYMTSKTTSIYKGVSITECGKWNARIHVNRKKIYLGVYATQEEAAIAYDNAAIHYHGEFASVNFPAILAGDKETAAAALAEGKRLVNEFYGVEL